MNEVGVGAGAGYTINVPLPAGCADAEYLQVFQDIITTAAERFRPFCSGRCKDVDLHRWFSGAYAIPAAESADDSEEQEKMRPRESD